MKYIFLVSIFLLFCPTISQAKTQKGIASWYGKENKISSTGKRLFNNKPGAAHKHLPIGSKVRVTDTKTHKSVVVVIEDRGPYTKHRIIDVNLFAARILGITKKGITHVTLEPLK